MYSIMRSIPAGVLFLAHHKIQFIEIKLVGIKKLKFIAYSLTKVLLRKRVLVLHCLNCILKVN